MNLYYRATAPVFIRTLQNVSELLTKAAAFAQEQGRDEVMLLEGRLAPDQFPLVRQIQILTDNAKNGAARLAGVEAPVWSDEEKTLAELKGRIGRTVVYLETLSPESFNDGGSRKVTLPYFPGKYIAGDEYLHGYLVPNFFFHVVTAYAILRHLGVPLGKADYLRGLVLQDL